MAAFSSTTPISSASHAAGVLALDHYRPSPGVVVIVARGEVDASNADTLTALVRDFRDSCDGLIFDFSAVDFLGTQGLRALDLLDHGAPRTALVASPAVARLFELCDTAPPIARAGDVSAALTQVQTDRPALHLVGGTAADPVVLLDPVSS